MTRFAWPSIVAALTLTLAGCGPMQQTSQQGKTAPSANPASQQDLSSESKGDDMPADNDQTIGQKLDEGIERTKSALNQAAETTEEKAQQAMKAAGDGLEKAGDQLQRAADDAGDTIEDGVRKAGESLEKLGEKAADDS